MPDGPDGFSRRSFIKLAATAAAAASVPACEPASRKLIPYVIPDNDVIPGEPSFYATTCMECPAHCGIVARVREGRVIKLEGNPLDPVSRGAICARGQAALQGVYNPDRLRHPMRREADGALHEITWDEALDTFNDKLRAAAGNGAKRVAIISSDLGPALRTILIFGWASPWRLQVPSIFYEPLDEAAAYQAAFDCFGRIDLPNYRIDRAEFLISFGADFLETWRSPVELTRQYAAFRAPRVRSAAMTVGHAVYVGPRMSLTAARCDEWLAPPLGTEANLAMGILHEVAAQGWVRPESKVDVNALKTFAAAYDPGSVEKQTGVSAAIVRRLAQQFAQANGAIAMAGTDDYETHLATSILNAATGNLGRTVTFYERNTPASRSSTKGIEATLESMRKGEIDVVLVTGSNPAYMMAPALRFNEAIAKVPFVVWFGTVPDETAEHAHLLLPIHHPLESWSEAPTRAGARKLVQPVMQPVFDSRAFGDILLSSGHAGGAPANERTAATSAVLEDMWLSSYEEEVRASRPKPAGAPNAKPAPMSPVEAAEIKRNFAGFWEQARREGGTFGEPQVADVSLKPDVLKTPPKLAAPPVTELSLFCYPHIFLYDGRGADKPWLSEIPEPVTQLVWDTWAEVHPDTARRLGLAQDAIVELKTPQGAIEAPVLISDHVRRDVIAVPLGLGHTALGRYAKGRGANPFSVLEFGRRTSSVIAHPTGKSRRLVSPLSKSDQMGRAIVEAISLDDIVNGVAPKREAMPPEPYEMYDDIPYPKHQWGMTIDLNSCTGCSACVAACYAENNLPFVGKEMIDRGRIMSWIRIERYVPTSPDAPQLYIAPMLCQQCHHAPCEPVCPVFAAYHTEEGLNGQVYNRCVGTRYCENNCPYKVRRFNWFKPEWPEPLNLQLNPDITTRGAGVMEKCNFCFQRIRYAEINAADEGRPVRDGEIVPACAQACPANAITFGDINDANGAMMRRRADNRPRDYLALEDLNTRPAITYLRDIYRRRGKA